MIVNHEHKFIFIRPTRCGTMSILQALRDHIDPDIKPTKTGINHPTATLGRNHLCDEEMWQSYYKFMPVRNPWAWWVSVWWRAKASGHTDEDFSDFLREPPYDKMDNMHGECPSVWGGHGVLPMDIEKMKQHDLLFLANKPIPIERHSVGLHEHYSKYYTPADKQIVAARNHKLIKMFNYRYYTYRGE